MRVWPLAWGDGGAPALAGAPAVLRGHTNAVNDAAPSPDGLRIASAYKNPSDGTVAVVAINNNTSATPLSVFLSTGAPCSVTPWVTSATDSLAAKAAVSVASSRFTYTLGAQSVTTFVGKP